MTMNTINISGVDYPTRRARAQKTKANQKKAMKKAVAGVVLTTAIMGYVPVVAHADVAQNFRHAPYSQEYLENFKVKYFQDKPLFEKIVPGVGVFTRMPDYVRHVDKSARRELKEIKYIVIHETGNVNNTAVALNNYNYFNRTGKLESSAAFIVDDVVMAQGLGLERIEWALGNGRFLNPGTRVNKSDAPTDMNKYNTVSIEICVNEGGDYLRAVANTVYLSRELKKAMPWVDSFKRHYDAFSEGTKTAPAGKNCPEKMIAETTWWTWDKFVFFAENAELPIPFIDFDPTKPETVTNGKVRAFLGMEPLKGTSAVSSAKKDASKETADIKELMDKLSVKPIEFASSPSVSLDIGAYSSLDTGKAFDNIKAKSKNLAYNDAMLKDIIRTIDMVARVEKINPHILMELANMYTGYFSFGGKVNASDFNFGAIRDRKGNFVDFGAMYDGVVAYVQQVKTLATKSKVILPNNNKTVLLGLPRREVSTAKELSQVLGVDAKVMESIFGRLK